MPSLLKNTDEYLYEKKRDVFVLHIQPVIEDDDGYPVANYRHESVEEETKIHLDWLDAHGIKWVQTGPSGLLEGWMGHYYVDFTSWEQPELLAYSAQFENEDGTSMAPDRYKMYGLSYQEWIESGDAAAHETYLIESKDPNYQY